MFKILSLDGGGARGSFIAGFLLELEQKTGEPIAKYFDLIAGTSTGGVIATLIALGVPMTEIYNIYVNKPDKIFTKNERYFNSIPGRLFTFMTKPVTRYFTGFSMDELYRSKYSFEGTISLLKDYTADKKLKDIHRCRLVIPSTNLIHGKPHVFKTAHLPDQGDNYDFYALDTVLATAAAPTYFDPVTLPGYGIFSDGGIWANNPGLVAYAEAVKISQSCKREYDPKFNAHEITILSVGTGHAMDNFSPPYLKAGVKWWSTKLLELMFEAQTQSSSFYLEKMLLENYVRINFERPHPDWGQIDDYRYAKDMAQMGKLLANKKFHKLKEMFLSEHVMPFVPYL